MCSNFIKQISLTFHFPDRFLLQYILNFYNYIQYLYTWAIQQIKMSDRTSCCMARLCVGCNMTS